jgi:hypothetical protein
MRIPGAILRLRRTLDLPVMMFRMINTVSNRKKVLENGLRVRYEQKVP